MQNIYDQFVVERFIQRNNTSVTDLIQPGTLANLYYMANVRR